MPKIKKAKTVYPSREVPHLWANQSVGHARNATGNLYFRGKSIFSYGSHFEIARHVKHGDRTAILFTTETYSTTTAKHRGIVRAAARNHGIVFEVPLKDGCESPAKWMRDYKERVDALLRGASVAPDKTRAQWLAEYEELLQEANRFAEFFGLKTRLELPEGFDSLEEAAFAAQVKHTKAQKAREAAKLKKQQAEIDEALPAWRSGRRDTVPHQGRDVPAYLRVKDEDVQTSQGASVPIDHARRAYRVLKRLHERNETFKSNGHTIAVGNYHIDRMEADTVFAGCHRIAWPEVELLAQTQGWDKETETP